MDMAHQNGYQPNQFGIVDDDFNDETFGDNGPLNDEWEFQHQKLVDGHPSTDNNAALPAFFNGQDGEDFLEEALERGGVDEDDFFRTAEKSGYENFEANHYPTASHHFGGSEDDYSEQNANDYFYFLDTENEANAQLDSQMESMFNLVLEDDDESVSALDHHRRSANSGSALWMSPGPSGVAQLASSPNPSASAVGGIWGSPARVSVPPSPAHPGQMHHGIPGMGPGQTTPMKTGAHVNFRDENSPIVGPTQHGGYLGQPPHPGMGSAHHQPPPHHGGVQHMPPNMVDNNNNINHNNNMNNNINNMNANNNNNNNGNPLAKFFGGMLPPSGPSGPMPLPSRAVLSVEELEAKLRGGPVAAVQQPPLAEQQQQPPMQQQTPIVPQQEIPNQQQPISANHHHHHNNHVSNNNNNMNNNINNNDGEYMEGGGIVEEGVEEGDEFSGEEAIPQEPPVFSVEQFPALSREAPATPTKPAGGPTAAPLHGKANWAPMQRVASSPSGAPVPISLYPPSSSLKQQGQGQGQGNNNMHGGYNRRPYNNNNSGSFRPRWRESKEMMTADEIDVIIRLQESQLHSAGTNPYAEDYYHQQLLSKKKIADNQPVGLHKPLFEAVGPTAARPGIGGAAPFKRAGVDPLEGVLGRIPSHSVRAPRPLLQIKLATAPANADESGENGGSSYSSSQNKAIQTLLLTIENSFNILLDIEDIDSLLKEASGSNHVNVAQLRQKREELTNELFESMHIHVLPMGTLPNRTQSPDEAPFIFPEDSILINLSLVQKGKKLMVRALPLLFPNQVVGVYFAYLRNLAILVSSPRLTIDPEFTDRLFNYLNNITLYGSVGQTIHSLHSILVAHTEYQLVHILQSKYGLTIVQNILKKAHDLNLSFFSRESNINFNMLPPEIAQLAQAGLHWKDVVRGFLMRLRGRLHNAVHSDVGNTDKIWEFFAVLVVNVGLEEKRMLMNELSDKIRATPMNPTLSAFLQLIGDAPFLPTPVYH